MSTQTKKIYTFWEPASNMSGYISLCIETWRKQLPDYEVIVLDYSNMDQYVAPELLKGVLCKKMTLAMQSDAIRAAIMYEQGGIWLDADTIITGPGVEDIIAGAQGETVMFGDTHRDEDFIFGAFIGTKCKHAHFVSEWCRVLPPRVKRWLRYKYFLQWFKRSEWRRIRKWNYCVNAIIEPLSREMKPEQYSLLDYRDFGCMPHLPKEGKLTSAEQRDAYCEYWFTPGDPEDAIRNSQGLIMLQNSWSPAEFRKMSRDEFLQQDTRMAALMRRLLA